MMTKELSTEYPLPERIIDLDAVTELLYEQGNLAEEVYRAVGGGALPFYSMLGEDSTLARELRATARDYLQALRAMFARQGVYASGDPDSQVEPRELAVERLTPTLSGPRPVFREREELMR